MIQTLKYAGYAGAFLVFAEVWVLHARLLGLIDARRRRRTFRRAP